MEPVEPLLPEVDAALAPVDPVPPDELLPEELPAEVEVDAETVYMGFGDVRCATRSEQGAGDSWWKVEWLASCMGVVWSGGICGVCSSLRGRCRP